MPRDGSGNVSWPAGTTAVSGTTIESAKFNAFTTDLQTILNNGTPLTHGGTGGTTAATARTNLGVLAATDTVAEIATVAALRLLTSSFTATLVHTQSYHAAADYVDGVKKGGAVYYYDAADGSTADDSCTVFVDAASKRWKLLHSGTISAGQAGCYLDGATDDLAAWNRIVVLLNAGTCEHITIEPGNSVISDNLDAITGSGFSIEGSGHSATRISFLAAATDKGCVFQFGTNADTVTNATISGLTVSNTDNTGTLTGADASMYFMNAVNIVVRECRFVDIAQMFRFGGTAAGETAIRIYFVNCFGAFAGIAGVPLILFNAATGIGFMKCYFSTGSAPTSTRMIKIAPVAAGVGCDSILINGTELNWNNAGADHLIEMDCSNAGISNVYIASGNVIDGGTISTFLLNINSGTTPAGNRIQNLIIVGNRVFSNTKFGTSCGATMKITHDADNVIDGIVVSGNTLGGDGVLVYSRTGAGPYDGWCDATFSGNAIVYRNETAGTGVVFSVDSGIRLTITGNTVTHHPEGNAYQYATFLTTAGANYQCISCTGNNLDDMGSDNVFDISAVGANLDARKIVIANNAGAPDPGVRKVTTTDATVTTLVTCELENGQTYLISGKVLGRRQTGGADNALYTFNTVAKCAAGTASIAGGGTPTTVYEDDSSWDLTIDATSNTIRFRVTGAAVTIDWVVTDFNVTVV